MFSDEELDQLFRAWWKDSYGIPPTPHSLMTYPAWGRFLLDQLAQRRSTESDGQHD
jgi:hypothetical protein